MRNAYLYGLLIASFLSFTSLAIAANERKGHAPEKVMAITTTKPGQTDTKPGQTKAVPADSKAISDTPKTPSTVFPKGCTDKGFKFAGQEVIFNSDDIGDKQYVYLIKNIATFDIVLRHVVTQPAASAGWDSGLSADRWTGFAVNKPNFALRCDKNANRKFTQVSCDKVVAVCGLPQPFWALLSKGTYWLGENQELPSLLRFLPSRGVSLP